MTDYRSRVPFYEFPQSLAAQEAALTTNPLLQRMLRARDAFAGDRYRPAYHYVTPESTLNDPNGLCFWQGRWHLFYQGYPPEDPREHWGHAVSDDLIHWRDLPYAIYPGPERCCFSGSTLVEDDRVIAMYHGTKAGNMVAVSSDPLLLNWSKVSGRAVIPLEAEDGTALPYPVFDPCIWSKDGVYYSLSGGAKPEGMFSNPVRAHHLFRSIDLEHWEYMHPFVEDDRVTSIGDNGHCPYFWPIGDRHMLLFFSSMSGGQYLLGDYDTVRDKFVVAGGGKFNHGATHPSGVHAPSASPDGQGGLIAIFNMNPGKPTEGWDQIMTLPRRLTLQETEVHIEPAGDIESLRTTHVRVGPLALPANEDVVLDEVSGDALELALEIDPQDATQVEVNVLRSPGREEYTRIAFFRERGFRPTRWNDAGGFQPDAANGWVYNMEKTARSVLVIDSSYASTAADVRSRPPEMAQLMLGPNEPLRLRVFIDRSVVEVFANGRQCVAVRVYPERADSVGVSLRSQGADAVVQSMDAWQMRSIWREPLHAS